MDKRVCIIVVDEENESNFFPIKMMGDEDYFFCGKHIEDVWSKADMYGFKYSEDAIAIDEDCGLFKMLNLDKLKYDYIPVLDSVMPGFWQPMSTAPTDGTVFQVSWWDSWYPRCKIVGDYVYEEVSSCDWEDFKKFSEVIEPLPNGKYAMMWAPVPVLHDFE